MVTVVVVTAVVVPENRPSVIKATSLPSPAPMIAEVGVSISGMPGPPLGPSYRMITTIPDERNTYIHTYTSMRSIIVHSYIVDVVGVQ